jgi:hypothetical protein
MKLSELMEKLNELIEENAVENAPFDPEIVFLTDKESFKIEFCVNGTLNTELAIFLSEKRYHN